MPSEKISGSICGAPFVVNTGWPAGKDQPIGFHCGDFGGRRVEANDLRIHLAFADPSRYDLRVLRTEIEDENFRVRWMCLRSSHATDEFAGRYAPPLDRRGSLPSAQAFPDR